MIKKYLITPGEFNSIGLEVTLKALLQLKENSELSDSYIVFTTKENLNSHINILNSPLFFKEIKNLKEATDKELYFINRENCLPVDWFKEAVEFCAQNSLNSALVTGPLVKSSFGNPTVLGHTEYLRSRFRANELFMTFFGEHYNCLLLNDHIPLSDVPSHISAKKIESALKTLQTYTSSKTKIALLGLNPHAGEDGLLGSEENLHHQTICKKYSNVFGPLPSDGFFSLNDYKKYKFIIANYHDQGLIPFKLIHGFNAAQATLGLCFVRTSVDHGTSSSLFLKNTASPSSMISALKLAKRLLELKINYHTENHALL